MNPVTMMEEVTFQARLKYVAFKRLIIVLEVCILVFLAMILQQGDVFIPILIAAQIAHLCAEIANHLHLQRVFNIRDPWILFPIFAMFLFA